MKHSLTFTALLVSIVAFGQTPYNPDSDSNQLIGLNDLLSLFTLYGQNWNPDSVVIYGISELVEPEFCSWPGNASDCAASRWRLVPDDADIIYWDLGNSFISFELWLPVNPKQLVLLGTSPNWDLTENAYFYNENQYYTGSGLWTFTSIENRNRLKLLIPFAEKYWIVE